MSDRVGPRRAAVVGSGFGGLAAAIRLQARGVDTVLFEARDKPGGRAYVYEQDGFTFDAGPTVITAPTCLYELFDIAGRRMDDYVELLPVKPFYRLLWEDGDAFDYDNDAEALIRQIRERNPADVEGYERFLDYSKRVFEVGYEGLADQPFLRFRDMLRVAPSLARFRADRPVYKTVSKFIKDPKLREAFSFHALLVGGNPFETSSIYTLIHYLERRWGVFFPKGGTGALVRGLVRLFEDIGGELRLETPVRRIDVDTSKGDAVHRVTTDRLTAEPFDLVVSNADVHHTYAHLYGGEKGGRKMQKKLERMDWSMSLFVLYFGTDRTYEDVAHHTVLFGPRYKGLLRDVFHGSELPDDFSLYLHAPTRTDPSLAPPGHEGFYVLSPVPHLGRADLDWDTIAPQYAEKLLASLEKTLPDLRKHVVTKRWFTPFDFRDELAAYQGSAFSVAPKLTQSAWFRPHNKADRIPGLYIVGAGTHPGAGVPGVVNTAKATVRVIAKDFDLPEGAIAAQTVDARIAEEIPA
ncbi:MAG: phytoene desaturase [Planctomycetota bacterium]|nr:phytoene desaturase [Planctomycetota bacterium]